MRWPRFHTQGTPFDSMKHGPAVLASSCSEPEWQVSSRRTSWSAVATG